MGADTKIELWLRVRVFARSVRYFLFCDVGCVWRMHSECSFSWLDSVVVHWRCGKLAAAYGIDGLLLKEEGVLA